MMSKALFWLTETNNQKITAYLAQQFSQCFGAWLNQENAVIITSVADGTDTNIRRLQSRSDQVSSEQVTLFFNQQALVQLLRLPRSASEKSQQLINGVIADCLADLFQQLFQQAQPTTQHSTVVPGHWCEAPIVVECQVATVPFTFLIDRYLLQTLAGIDNKAGPEGQLVPLAEALAEEPIEIQVMAGTVGIKLAELQRLEPGTVIITDALVREPMAIQLVDQQLANGFIGKHKNQKALVIAGQKS